MSTMRAVVIEATGAPDVMNITEIEQPSPANSEFLVKVIAAGVNPIDAKTRDGRGVSGLLTYPANMLGTPAISVPAGFEREGVPVGLQIAGGLHAEALVIRAAAAFEAARPWAGKRPPEFEIEETAVEVDG